MPAIGGSWRRAGLFGCRSEPYTPISHVLSRCAWNQPDSRVTANERISRVNGRERNEECDVTRSEAEILKSD